MDNFGTSVDAYKDIDFSLLKAAGYTELTDALEIAGDLAIVAGEIGLEALKVLWKHLNIFKSLDDYIRVEYPNVS